MSYFMLSAHAYVWNCYIDYLWNYDSNSWVATIAYIFRIWAIIAILPPLVLSLLDVTSYVIARTLGDPTASTSHKSSFDTDPSKHEPSPISSTTASTIIANTDPPATATATATGSAIGMVDAAVSSTSITTSTTTTTIVQDEQEELRPPKLLIERPTPPDAQTPTFFVAEDDGAARLAGVGVFSPVASLPGSPITSRKNLLEKHRDEEEEEEEEDEDEGVCVSSGSDSASGGGISAAASLDDHRGHGHGGDRRGSEGEGSEFGCGGEATCGSTSGESSFALLEREESFEDAATHIRRRVPGTTSGDELT